MKEKCLHIQIPGYIYYILLFKDIIIVSEVAKKRMVVTPQWRKYVDVYDNESFIYVGKFKNISGIPSILMQLSIAKYFEVIVSL